MLANSFPISHLQAQEAELCPLLLIAQPISDAINKCHAGQVVLAYFDDKSSVARLSAQICDFNKSIVIDHNVLPDGHTALSCIYIGHLRMKVSPEEP